MSDNNNLRKVRVKKRTRLGFNWFFWISFVLILIPVIYFASLLYQANQETHTPIVGTRITDTVTNKIEESALTEIKNEIAALEGVEGSEVNLIVETLRISIDGTETLGSYTNEAGETVAYENLGQQYTALAEQIYGIIDKHLPISEYFTPVEEYKQYDLEINIYDNLDNETPVLVTLVKNSAMETYHVQTLSDPVNPELAYDLLHPTDESQEPVDDDATDDMAEDEAADGEAGE